MSVPWIAADQTSPAPASKWAPSDASAPLLLAATIDLSLAVLTTTLRVPVMLAAPVIDLTSSMPVPTLTVAAPPGPPPVTVDAAPFDLSLTVLAPTLRIPVMLAAPALDLTLSVLFPTIAVPVGLVSPVIDLTMGVLIPALAEGVPPVVLGTVPLDLGLTMLVPDLLVAAQLLQAPGFDLTLTVPPPTLLGAVPPVTQYGVSQVVLVGISTGYPKIARPIVVTIPDTDFERAPTALTVYIFGAPDVDVTIQLDGVDVFTGASVGGILGPVSLDVGLDPVTSAYYAQGIHQLTATAPGGAPSDSAIFTLSNPPAEVQVASVPDPGPAQVSGTSVGTVQRWVFQDLLPIVSGGLGSFVLPANPQSMAPLPIDKTAPTATHTTSPSGQYHLTDAIEQPHPWTFAGRLFTQEFYDKLVAFASLNRRWYLIDHRNRAWTVTILNADLTPQKRHADNVTADWEHAYTIQALIYSSKWKEPT